MSANFSSGLALKQRQNASTKRQIEPIMRIFDALLTTFDFSTIPLYIMPFFERADTLFCLLSSVCCFGLHSERVPRWNTCYNFFFLVARTVSICNGMILLSMIASYFLVAASANFHRIASNKLLN